MEEEKLYRTLNKLLTSNTLNSGSSGSYEIPLSRIQFSFDGAFEDKVAYNISEQEFVAEIDKISRLLTSFHEATHFIQAWSTTSGIVQFLLHMNQDVQFMHILDKTSFKLPLHDYSESIIKKIQGSETATSEEAYFSRLYTGLKYQKLAYQWFTGTLPEEASKKAYSDTSEFDPKSFVLTYEISFITPDLDEGYGMSGKKYIQFGALSPNGITPTAIGTSHLFECFAKSVEFEHLIWFNKDIANTYIKKWMYDDDNIKYNAPFRLILQTLDENTKNNIPLLWAHVRVFIDIALMYSDFLFLDVKDISGRDIIRQVNQVKQHPGVTFNKIIKAFNKIRPLENNDEDIIRLYNELTDKLGFPRLDEMNKKLLQLVDILLEKHYTDNTGIRSLIIASKSLLKKRMKNPLLFINGLIYPDKFSELFHEFRKHSTIFTPSGLSISTDGDAVSIEDVYENNENIVAGIIVECLNDLREQAITKNELKCPMPESIWGCLKNKESILSSIWNRVKNKEENMNCIANRNSNNFNSDCFIAKQLKSTLDRVVE